jgi:hypothetical protein
MGGGEEDRLKLVTWLHLMTREFGIIHTGLKFTCSLCRSPMQGHKTYKQHFENKHPKAPMPDELKDVTC